MVGAHPFVPLLLEFRHLKKVHGSLEGFIECMREQVGLGLGAAPRPTVHALASPASPQCVRDVAPASRA